MYFPCLHGDLNLISFDCDNTAFIIAVPGCPRSADNGITVILQPFGQRIHRFLTADGKCDMRIAGTGESSPPDSKNQMELPKLVGSGLSGS